MDQSGDTRWYHWFRWWLSKCAVSSLDVLSPHHPSWIQYHSGHPWIPAEHKSGSETSSVARGPAG